MLRLVFVHDLDKLQVSDHPSLLDLDCTVRKEGVEMVLFNKGNRILMSEELS